MFVAIIIILSITAIAVVRQERKVENRREIQHHYLKVLLMGNSQSERYIEEITRLSGVAQKLAAVELLAKLSPVVYRLDPQPIENISQSLHLSEFLLEEVRKARGDDRAIYLYVFSRIPPSITSTSQVVKYLRSEDRMTRFCALLAVINIDKANALRYIARYTAPLTPFETSHLLSLLLQGSITIACQPMLHAKNLNLNLLGLAVVRHFSIESAEHRLHQMIAEESDYTLKREVLYTLVSMQLMLCSPSIKQFVDHMSHMENRRFLRYIVSEGYSQSVVDFFLSHENVKYYQSLINSYKIKIGCL